MSTHRYIDAICVVILLLTLLITVVFINGEKFGIQVIVDEDAEDFARTGPFTENDQNGAWDTSSATIIKLNGDHGSVTGGGAYAYDGNIIISSSGKYILSGTLSNGSVIVDTNNTAKVWIMLNGAEICCDDGACLDVEQADKVFLSLADGTENSMSTMAFSEVNQTAGMDGALFSRDDLTINGTGSLAVTAENGHGIVCNDELVITGGDIFVKAAEDALHVNDDLRIMAVTLNLDAGDDGISLTGTESELYYESGMMTVKAAGDGINAENIIRFLGGDFSAETGDDGISAGGVRGELQISSGTLKIRAADRGISAENIVSVTGGTVSIDSENDGISTAGDLFIEAGELTITTADDGMHADHAVTISGGTVRIPDCYEGIEAVTIDISGGDITVYPKDDGLNANGGTDAFGMMWGGNPRGRGNGMRPFSQNGQDASPAEGSESPDGSSEMPWTELPELSEEIDTEKQQPGTDIEPSGQNDFDGNVTAGTKDEETWIHIRGGSITVINNTARDADGLDSNGDIIISGGTVRVSLTNSGSNSALDYSSENGGRMEISGGEVIACGSYSMAEGFDASSTQCSVLYNIKRGAAAGTSVLLEDNEGNILMSYEAPCSFSSVALSCPEMKLGECYTVVIGDSEEEITLEEVSASFGDAQSENFGGPMNWGGMKFRPKG